MDADAAGAAAPPLPAAAIAALQQGNKIEAIRITRQERRIGLKEAKEAVDDYVRAQPSLHPALAAAPGQAKHSGALWLVVVVLVAYLAYRFFAKS